jgi:anti-sigma regulatory factor (Ser/Thr protein kinase)
MADDHAHVSIFGNGPDGSIPTNGDLPIHIGAAGYGSGMAGGLERPRLELYLPATRRAVAQARAAVDGLEALDRHPGVRFAVRLLVTELFTNALEHGVRGDDARVRVAVAIEPTHVRAEVADPGPGFDAGAVAMPDPDGESGRGLAFLDALASRWGIARKGENCVWFELDLEV